MMRVSMFIVDTSDTYFLDKLYEDMDKLCNRYNNILSKKVIGKSVEGRDIVALKIVGEKGEILLCAQNDKKISAHNDEKPLILFVGGIHAREDFSVMLCMKMIEQYCYYYSEGKIFDGFDVMNIIDNIDMHFVPVVNPDGLNIVHNGQHGKSTGLFFAEKAIEVYNEINGDVEKYAALTE